MKKKNIILIIVLILIVLGILLITKNKKEIIDTTNIITYELTEKVRGNIESEIILQEFSDFQCPACKSTVEIIEKLDEYYGDKIKIEFKHFPLRNIHPNAQIASQAAEAAGIQGKFWEMHDLLYEKQDEWSRSFLILSKLKKYAKEIGINGDQFIKDLTSKEVKEVVDGDYNIAQSLQLRGSPTFILNGDIIELNSLDNISSKIDELLTEG